MPRIIVSTWCNEAMKRSLADEAYNYIMNKTTFKAVILLVLVFTISMSLPLIYSNILQSQIGSIAQEESQGIQETLNYPLYLLPVVIYLRNLSVSVILAVTAVTIIIPFLIIIINGIIVALVISALPSQIAEISPYLVDEPGKYALFIYASLVPHGVVEIPTIVLAAAVMAYLAKGIRTLGRKIPSALYIASANLMAAAIIESTVTFVLALTVILLIS